MNKMNKGFEEASETMESELQLLMDNPGSAVLIDKDRLQILIWLLSGLRQKIERMEFEERMVKK